MYKETIANERNTPHLRENTWIIVMSWLFSGLHFLVFGLFLPEIADLEIGREEIWGFVVMGIVFLLMALISVWDKRKGERGTASAVAVGIVHLMICVLLSFASSFWWMAAYAGEVMVCTVLLLIGRKRR